MTCRSNNLLCGVALCLLLFACLLQRPLVSSVDDDITHSSSSSTCIHESSSGLHLQHPHSGKQQGVRSPTRQHAAHSPSRAGAGGADTVLIASPGAAAGAAAGAAVVGSGPKQCLSWQHVLSEAWPSCAALAFLYTTTLAIFPGVLAEDLKVGVGCFYFCRGQPTVLTACVPDCQHLPVVVLPRPLQGAASLVTPVQGSAHSRLLVRSACCCLLLPDATAPCCPHCACVHTVCCVWGLVPHFSHHAVQHL